MANREQKRRMDKGKKNNTNVVKEEKKKGFLEEKLGEEMASFVKTILVVVIVFLIILGLTLIMNKTGVFDEGYTKPDRGATVISYEEILIGEVFNRVDSVYYVVFDNFGDKTVDVYLNQKLSEYTGDVPIYKVDMTKELNERYRSETGNAYATTISDLKIKTPTMIKISGSANVGYFEGTDNIVNELFK